MGPIGIFDSGIGGLGIAKAINELLPNEDIVYLADSKNCPYGTKPVSVIQKICSINTDYLVTEHKAKIVVVACNTATVTSIKKLRSKYPNIPIIGVVPVVKAAKKLTQTKEIAVLSTPNTLKSSAYKNLLKMFTQGIKVWDIPCPGLADEIDQNPFNTIKIRSVVKACLKPYLGNNFDVAVLGCTHYTLIEPIIQEEIGNSIKLLDSNHAVARQVKSILETNNLMTNQEDKGKIKVKMTGDLRSNYDIIKSLLSGVINI